MPGPGLQSVMDPDVGNVVTSARGRGQALTRCGNLFEKPVLTANLT